MKPVFEWDETKASENLRKHKISFDEAETVFDDPLAITIPDPEHSKSERRFIDLGQSETGRIIVVSYTQRARAIRIIGARRATRTERLKYEEESQ
jgi:uncharacterized DUF497 family protein